MDDKHSIGVYIKGIDFLETDFSLYNHSIDGYLIDKTSGSCIKANSSSSNLFSYESPFTLPQKEADERSFFQKWSRLLVFEADFSQLNSESKILMFEICKTVQSQKTEELDKIRFAWAFLVPLASDGSTNTNKDLKLQLYKVRKKCKISHQDCNIFHLYSDHKLKKFLGSLQISVKGVVPINTKPAEVKDEEKHRPLAAEDEKLAENISQTLKPVSKSWEWSRLPSQTCKVPNKIHQTYSLGKNGVSCLRFSRNGFHIAASVLSLIIIYDVISGEEVIVLNSHIGFIYELDWSLDDEYLLSVSNDCRGAIWSLNQKTPLFVLPHPSYVYCGRWIGSNEQIVTGGKDHLIRYWRRNGNSFDLIDEISGHSGFVSALATQNDSYIFSGDSHGCIMIRKLTDGVWVVINQFNFSEIAQSVIDSIHIHSSRRRIIVSVRSRGSYLIDIVSGIILQGYKSAVNTFARCISSLTPCGSFLFSFCQNGDVGVWEVNTGKLFATYDNLFPIERLSELSGTIHYHPYEHMIGITALGQSCPIMILKHEMSQKDDSEKLGLTYSDKKVENFFTVPVLASKWSLKLQATKSSEAN